MSGPPSVTFRSRTPLFRLLDHCSGRAEAPAGCTFVPADTAERNALETAVLVAFFGGFVLLGTAEGLAAVAGGAGGWGTFARWVAAVPAAFLVLHVLTIGVGLACRVLPRAWRIPAGEMLHVLLVSVLAWSSRWPATHSLGVVWAGFLGANLLAWPVVWLLGRNATGPGTQQK